MNFTSDVVVCRCTACGSQATHTLETNSHNWDYSARCWLCGHTSSGNALDDLQEDRNHEVDGIVLFTP